MASPICSSLSYRPSENGRLKTPPAFSALKCTPLLPRLFRGFQINPVKESADVMPDLWHFQLSLKEVMNNLELESEVLLVLIGQLLEPGTSLLSTKFIILIFLIN